MVSFRVGLVGCGPRGLEHAEAIRAAGGFELSGATDLDGTRSAVVKDRLGAASFSSMEDLLGDVRPEVVVLATPVLCRQEAALRILDQPGLRALIIEKPVASSLADARMLVDRAAANGVRILTGHQLRWCPEFEALRTAWRGGKLGEVRQVRGFCHGSLLSQGVHLLDLLQWCLQDEELVWAQSMACCDEDRLARLGAPDVFPDPRHPGPPWTLLELAFAHGLRVTLEVGPLHQRSDVFVDPWLQKRLLVTGTAGWAEAQSAGFFRLFNADGHQHKQANLDAYLRATMRLYQGLHELLTGVTDEHRNELKFALPSLGWLSACARSIAEGVPVEGAVDPTWNVVDLLQRKPATGSPGTASEGLATAGLVEEGPEFSIIVPVLDHRGHLEACLRSWVEGQRYPGQRYEILLVGNGEDAELEREAKRLLRPQDRYIFKQTPVEIELYDHAARLARGKWILMTEPHVEAEPECLKELAQGLMRQRCDGACLRSISVNKNAMARCEDRFFSLGFQLFSAPDNWCKVILRGIVIRRDVYLESGGFPVKYDRFAEFALAAILHRMGKRLVYIPGAAVRHHNVTRFSDLAPHVRTFPMGECSYRAENDATFCRTYFGQAPEWENRHAGLPGPARELLMLGLRALPAGCLSGIRHSRRALAGHILKELPGWLSVSLFGSRARVALAAAKAGWARFRYHLCVSEDARFKAFVDAYNSMVSEARHERSVEIASGEQVLQEPATNYGIEDLRSAYRVGFHAREERDERPFRWSYPVAFLRLPAPAGGVRVRLDTGGLRRPEHLGMFRLYAGGRRVSDRRLRHVDGGIEFDLDPSRSALLTIGWVCSPLPMRGASPVDPRPLGLPVFGIEVKPL